MAGFMPCAGCRFTEGPASARDGRKTWQPTSSRTRISSSFDVEYYPGIRPGQANRYNVLDQPYFFDAAQALLGPERDQFLSRYKFDVRPATDDRPYFFHFFKWRTLPELLSLKAQGGLPLLEWGYPVLVATLLQATALALLLIVVPLWIPLPPWPTSAAPVHLRRRSRPQPAAGPGGNGAACGGCPNGEPAFTSWRSASASCSWRSPSSRNSSCS